MAITSVGYDGSVSEVQWSQMVPNVGSSNYGVVGVNDWKVTAHATLDKGVNIAAGSGFGHGIFDTSSSTTTVTGAALASGTRYDLVVAKRDWTGAGGVTTFRIISGTSSRTIPTRATTPGSVDEQPIALLRFDSGQTKPVEIVDLRVWTGTGGAVANDEMALGYLNTPGGRVVIKGGDWLCTSTSSGPTWMRVTMVGRFPMYGIGSALAGPTAPPGTDFLIQAGTVVRTTDASGYSRFSWPKPFPNGLLTVTLTAGDDWANGRVAFFNVAGRTTLWGSAGTGNLSEVVYVMQASDTAGNNWGKRPNTNHRVNFIAIGW